MPMAKVILAYQPHKYKQPWHETALPEPVLVEVILQHQQVENEGHVRELHQGGSIRNQQR